MNKFITVYILLQMLKRTIKSDRDQNTAMKNTYLHTYFSGQYSTIIGQIIDDYTSRE